MWALHRKVSCLFCRLETSDNILPRHSDCSFDDNIALRRAYKENLGSAYRRGIPFHLTFEQWIRIWRESGKLHLRGKTKGSYQLSRYGDTGAYEIGNVFIQSQADNVRESCTLKPRKGGKPPSRKGCVPWNKGLSGGRKGTTKKEYFRKEIENEENGR